MKFKPCPFCGSKNIAIMREGKSDKNAAYRVVCRKCKTRGPKVRVQPYEGNKFIAQGVAWEAWNQRPGKGGNPDAATELHDKG